MIAAFGCFVGGVVVGAVAGYFFRKNNEKHFKAMEAKAAKVKDIISN